MTPPRRFSTVALGQWPSLTLVLAGAAGVLQVLGKAVRPAVEEGDAIAHMGVRGLTCLLNGGSVGLGIRCVRGVLGSMEAGSLCSQFCKPSFFVFVEMELKVRPCVVGFIFIIPGFDGVGVDTGFAEGKQCELDCGAIRDGLVALGGDGADNLDIFP